MPTSAVILHVLTMNDDRGVYVCRTCTGEFPSVMLAYEVPCVGVIDLSREAEA